LLEIQIARTFEKTRRAFAVDDDAKVFLLAQIYEPRCAVEDTFDRSDAGADSRRKRVLGSFFETLATRNTALQHRGVDEALIDAFSSCVELMSALKFHFTLAFAA
jgi:hypothetical protein